MHCWLTKHRCWVIDAAAVVPPQSVDFVSTQGDATEFATHDGRLLVLSAGKLQLYNVDDPTQPAWIDEAPTVGHGWEVTVMGDIAYVVDLAGPGFFVTYDLSDAGITRISNHQIGVSGAPSEPRSVAVRGDYAYVAVKTPAEVQVFDVSNPAAPTLVRQVSTEAEVRGARIMGDHLVLAGFSGLQVYSLTDPTTPTLLASGGNAEYWNLDSAGVFAFAPNYFGFDVYNLAETFASGAVPVPVAQISVPLGEVKNLRVQGQKLLIIDTDVQIWDVSLPTSPQHEVDISTPGYAQAVMLQDDFIYVADGKVGLTILPPPIYFTPDTVSDDVVTATIPDVLISGDYTITASDGLYEQKLANAVSYIPGLSGAKAIIVAGGGPYTGNLLWSATRKAADFAYRALTFQGYRHEDILYLSAGAPGAAHVDPDLSEHVDENLTLGSLQHAIEHWVLEEGVPADELLLYVVDHGGDGIVELNLNEDLMASELDGWLDDLQSQMSGRLIVVYDACQSGSFLPHLIPPGGKDRVVMSSSAASQNAVFANGGNRSFSVQFWTDVIAGGGHLYKAFVAADDMMGQEQQAQVDADGNGVPGERDDRRRARDQAPIGRGAVAETERPFVSAVSSDQVISGTPVATIRASGIIDPVGIARVWGYGEGRKGKGMARQAKRFFPIAGYSQSPHST